MLKILEPFNGAVLNARTGVQTPEGLQIRVSGIAPCGMAVSVNGVAAKRAGDAFSVTITLTAFQNDITASAIGPDGEASHRIRVVWDKFSRKRYRFAIDDNSFFLRDLFQKKPKDLFENYYLAILKRIHDEYGSKFSINCFFETPEKDFNLTMLPDCWKQQFLDNSNWLKLTWHAYNEFPDRPYEHASAATVIHDLDLVNEQIVRFAGDDTWCMPTIIHWGEIQSDVLPALYKRGVRAFSGYFTKSRNRYMVAFGLDENTCGKLEHTRLLMHWPSGIVFSRLTGVINCTPIENIIPMIQKDMDSPDTAEIIDLLTHEQYFWPFYKNYIPDHAKRMETAARFVTEHGYEPVFFHEGFLGVPHP